MFRIHRAVIAICILFSLFAQSTYSLAESSLVTGMDAEQFNALLREDRLMLARVEAPGLDDVGTELISLSPDGTRLLYVAEDGLYLYALEDGSAIKLMPQTGESGLSQEQIETLFARVEAVSISWSPDAAQVLFSFPRRIFLDMRYSSNVWLCSTGTGEITPLIAFPENFAPIKSYEGEPFMIPILAQFDGQLPHQADIMLRGPYPSIADIEVGRIDLTTGETALIGRYPNTMLGRLPCTLWRAGGNLVAVLASQKGPADYAGLAVMRDGEQFTTVTESSAAGSIFLHGSCMIAALDDTAILYNATANDNRNEHRYPYLAEIHLDEQGAITFDGFLALDLSTPADQRLKKIPFGEYDFVNSQALANPYNAVYSPDGAYMLLAAVAAGEPQLYIVNRHTGECGIVSIPAYLHEDGTRPGFSYGAGTYSLRGIEWADHNRLLLTDGTSAHLYTFVKQ